jgi:uncharacterized protein (UPF0212 family)
LPTSYEPPIKRLRVEAFRGFRDSREFELDASAIIVTGPNGTGKTSFFDALQWCFLGSVQRLEDLRAKRTVEHLVNQYRLGDLAIVEVDMVVGGKAFTIRRTGDHTGSTLEIRGKGSEPFFGEEAEVLLRGALVRDPEMTLEMALTTSGLMQQDIMRSVLEAKPADRYRHLSTVLGLAGLEDFEEAARELAKDAKSRSDAARAERDSMKAAVAAGELKLAAANERLQALPQLEALRQEIVAPAQSKVSSVRLELSVSNLETSEGARRLAQLIGDAIDQFEAFVRASDESSKSLVPPQAEPSDEELAGARGAAEMAATSVSESRQLFETAEQKLAAAQAASEEVAALAALAIPLLSSNCPVCGQSIDRGHVEAELLARVEGTETMLTLRSEVDQAKGLLDAASLKSQSAKQAVIALEEGVAAWKQHRNVRAGTYQAFETLHALAPLIVVSAPNPGVLAETANDSIEFLHSTRRKILELLNALERGADQGAVERARSEVASLAESLAAREVRLAEESQRAKLLKNLSDGAIDSRVEVTQQRFQAVQPLVANIFSRLDPHPAFKTIEFELDTYYRRGTTSPMVRDVVEGIAADPLVIFSTSQANIAALSYFLAMGISVGDKGLPFVLLDDPVQSMDDINVLGFADLCRHLRLSRQMIISTHDRRFARLLERKLSPREKQESTELIEFLGWDRSGPAVEQRVLDPQLLQDPIRIVKIAS